MIINKTTSMKNDHQLHVSGVSNCDWSGGKAAQQLTIPDMKKKEKKKWRRQQQQQQKKI